MDMSRMMAQLTMEAITATLKPKVSYGGTAAGETRPPPAWGLLRTSASSVHGGGREVLVAGAKFCAHCCRVGLSGNTAV